MWGCRWRTIFGKVKSEHDSTKFPSRKIGPKIGRAFLWCFSFKRPNDSSAGWRWYLETSICQKEDHHLILHAKNNRDLRRNFFAFRALPQQTATEGLLLSPWPQCYFNNIRCEWAYRRTCFFHALQFLPCWHCVQKSRLWAGVRKILWPALIETSPRPSEQSKHCQGDLRRPVDMSRLRQAVLSVAMILALPKKKRGLVFACNKLPTWNQSSAILRSTLLVLLWKLPQGEAVEKHSKLLGRKHCNTIQSTASCWPPKYEAHLSSKSCLIGTIFYGLKFKGNLQA